MMLLYNMSEFAFPEAKVMEGVGTSQSIVWNFRCVTSVWGDNVVKLRWKMTWCSDGEHKTNEISLEDRNVFECIALPFVWDSRLTKMLMQSTMTDCITARTIKSFLHLNFWETSVTLSKLQFPSSYNFWVHLNLCRFWRK